MPCQTGFGVPGCAVRDLLMVVEFWELGMAWRQWKFWMGVHRAEETLRRFGMERIRGATRQWVFNLWCSVCSARIAAIAKAASDEEATMQEAVAKAATTIEATTKIAADAAKAAADAAEAAAVAKAAEVIKAKAARAIAGARARECKCYEDMRGLVVCEGCKKFLDSNDFDHYGGHIYDGCTKLKLNLT